MSGGPISRRSWLWTSTTGLAAVACARPQPTQLPETGPEPARPLTRRGAENLIALAELAAGIRWLHPADQVQSAAWEPTLLAGIRGLEGAADRTELLEGLRGLFTELAPTVVLWRSDAEDEATKEQLDELACPDPNAAEDDEQEQEQPADRAREPEQAKTQGKADGGRKGPPARNERSNGEAGDSGDSGDSATADAKTPDSEQADADKADAKTPDSETPDSETPDSETPDAKTSKSPDAKTSGSKSPDPDKPDADKPDSKASDSETSDSETPDSKASDSDKPDAKTSGADEPDSKAPDADKPDADKPDADEPDADKPDADERPPIPKALLDPRDDLKIVQWHRRGFSEGLPEQPGCARRLWRDPEARSACGASHKAAPAKPRGRPRRMAGAGPCSRCDGDSYVPLTPADPATLTLGRGLSALVPTALWAEAGRSLPTSNTAADPTPAFDAVTAADYALADRGTRLLAVLRAHAALRYFFPHAVHASGASLREPLLRALCRASEYDTPAELRITLERLLAEVGDGNGVVETAPGWSRRQARRRRWRAPLALRWIDERVVVTPLVDEPLPAGLLAGDELVTVDGQDIAALLPEVLARTPAATASAKISRAVTDLLARDREGVSLAIEVLRRGPEGEARHGATVSTSLVALDSIGGDHRPSKAFTELDDGHVYADATRLPNLQALARKLHRRRRRLRGLILDLRGELADEQGSLLPHCSAAPLTVANERLPAGPDRDGALPLADAGTHRLHPDGPAISCPVIVLIDERTRGRAELEAAGFDLLAQATLLGSPSAGDLAPTAAIWLPGGWQLRFTCGELRRADGSALWGVGVAPSVSAPASGDGLREGIDELLAAAGERLT